MAIDVDIGVLKDDESWAESRERRRIEEEKERRKYFKALAPIKVQHHRCYTFSETGCTDRVSGTIGAYWISRRRSEKTLYQDFVEVDLRSAHLLIAAGLWDAGEALEKLTDEDYSVWDDLMAHFDPLFLTNEHTVPEKGNALYQEVKEALKIAAYSTVHGMNACFIQA